MKTCHLDILTFGYLRLLHSTVHLHEYPYMDMHHACSFYFLLTYVLLFL